MAELEQCDARVALTGSDLYAAAVACAVCGPAAAHDEAINPAERAKRSETFAARAVAFLKRAGAAGYFRLPGRAEMLKADREFEPLRGRADFQALLQ